MKKFLLVMFVSITINAQWKTTSFNNGFANCLTSDKDGNLYTGLLYLGLSTANKSGIYYSNDGGNNWNNISNGLPQLTINVIKVINNTIFIGTPKGRIYKSINNGATWEKLNTGIDTLSYVMQLETFGGNIFAGTNNKGIYISSDNGITWKQANSGVTGLVANSLYATSTEIFAGVNNKYIYKYDISNSSWIKLPSNGMPNASINAIAEINDGKGNKYLFAGLFSSVTEVAVSIDNGSNWNAADTGLPNVPVYTLAVVGSNLFLGNDYGVYRSTNFGNNWEDVKTGLNQSGSYSTFLTKGKTDLFVIQGGKIWKRAYSDFGITDVKEIASEIPSSFELFQNYPNPFNPSTTIKYSIPNVMISPSNHDNVNLSLSKGESLVTMKLYDILGNEVETLVNEIQPAGNYEVKFDASKLSGGVYFYKLQVRNFVQTKKMILIK